MKTPDSDAIQDIAVALALLLAADPRFQILCDRTRYSIGGWAGLIEWIRNIAPAVQEGFISVCGGVEPDFIETMERVAGFILDTTITGATLPQPTLVTNFTVWAVNQV